MGRQSKTIKLSSDQQAELEKGYKQSNQILSKRCHMILLKGEGRSSQEVADLLRTNHVSVSNWLIRYEEKGIDGLKTKKGQGRKPILNKETDKLKIKNQVKKERQRLKNAKDEIEKELGKEFSMRTLKRFLKNLSADGNVSA